MATVRHNASAAIFWAKTRCNFRNAPPREPKRRGKESDERARSGALANINVSATTVRRTTTSNRQKCFAKRSAKGRFFASTTAILNRRKKPPLNRSFFNRQKHAKLCFS
jgi:hypothetical protein